MPQHIIGLRGPLTGQRFPLGEAPLSFGRSAASTVVLAHRQASRQHAELRREAAGYMLYDHGSRNGTFVNGERITTRLLQPGDQIAIGDEVFGFQIPTNRKATPLGSQIVAVGGPLIGRRFTLDDTPFAFGRSAASTVVLADRQASRQHAELRREAAGYMLYDHGSRNGTFVNGERITTRLLQPGDQIAIGDEVFGFETGAMAAASAASAPAEPSDAQPAPPARDMPVRRRPHSHKPVPTYGIRCPSCGRVIEPQHQHCPWDGALLANGQTAAVAAVVVSTEQ